MPDEHRVATHLGVAADADRRGRLPAAGLLLAGWADRRLRRLQGRPRRSL